MKRWLVFIAALVIALPVQAQQPGKVQFGRDVLPILSTHCFTCHGPDAKTIKGGLNFGPVKGRRACSCFAEWEIRRRYSA